MLAAWRRLREARVLRDRAIPQDLWSLTLARYPFLARRSPQDLEALRRLATLFLADKEFHGAGGFVVTDAVAVAIAAQACLPVLRLGLDWYDDFVGIVVHADEVMARREVVDDDGVVHRYDEVLTGEAMERGPVMLSWRDVETAGETAERGYNVVVHEFAHIIDMRDGQADGVPPLPGRAAREAWFRTLDDEFEQLCRRLDAGVQTLMDPYAAEGHEEFFAVASETFFVAPADLLEEHPAFYAQLRGFFRQHPAAALAA
jgi:Mlc titration factor MtfA (ptsG expression regulator)